MHELNPHNLRMMARRLEGIVLLLETCDDNARMLAGEIRNEVERLRRWANELPNGAPPQGPPAP